MQMEASRVVIGDCTLYCEDCRFVLPTLRCVDALITDPVWPNCPPGLIPGGDDPQGLWNSVWSVMPPLVRAVIVMRHDSDPRFLAPVRLPYARAAILGYVMPGYIGRYLGGDEIAYCFGNAVPSTPGRRVIPGRAPLAQPGDGSANGHPCSRALGHFKWLVNWWSEPGETVLDPFMGSGTTGVACAQMGRKFIGVEIDRRYFDIACRRIEDAYRQRDMFVAPPEQMSLLDRGAS
jgi:hypothetical protein